MTIAHDLKVYGAIIFATVLLCAAGYGLVEFAQPVNAASAAKQQEEGTCVQFAVAGNFAQYHCIDPNGNEYDTNAVGMMIAVGN